MPNWCVNRLDVEGRRLDVERFATENSGEDSVLSFERSVPTKNPSDDWGTKWDACEARLDGGPSLIYYFDTAWAPPIEWLEKTAIKYPELVFSLSFAEPGMDFCGELVISGIEVIESFDSSIDYNFTEEKNLLNWPECWRCDCRLSEAQIAHGEYFCDPCAETDMMERGRAA